MSSSAALNKENTSPPAGQTQEMCSSECNDRVENLQASLATGVLFRGSIFVFGPILTSFRNLLQMGLQSEMTPVKQ